MDVIEATLKATNERDAVLANYASITVARVGLFFAGKSTITVKDLLPFAFPGESTAPKLSDKTQEILRELVKRGDLPNKVISAWSKEIKSLGLS